MKNAIQTEIRKFFTTRMWWVLLLLFAGYMIFLAAVMAMTLTQQPQTGDDTFQSGGLDDVKSIYTIAVSLGYVFPALVAVMSVTGEFRHKTIVPTLLFDPSRTRFLLAKLCAAIPVGVVYGVVGALCGLGAGAGTLAIFGFETYLTDPEVWRSSLLSVLALTAWTVLGVGIGSMIKNQVAAIVVILAFTQFVEPILRMALPAVLDSKGEAIASFLPGAAGEALSEASLYTTLGAGDLLAWWQGALVLVLYGLVFAAIGRATTLRRDVIS